MGKVKIGNFKGPQGETGPQGPAGPQGPEGPQGPMGEVDANTQIVFTQATSRENIASGEKLNIILGKVRKWFADIKGAAFQDVSNTLTTTEAGKVLDARQGKVLDGKVSEKLAKTDVVNGLTETAAGKALDARQGKVLDEKIDNLSGEVSDLKRKSEWTMIREVSAGGFGEESIDVSRYDEFMLTLGPFAPGNTQENSRILASTIIPKTMLVSTVGKTDKEGVFQVVYQGESNRMWGGMNYSAENTVQIRASNAAVKTVLWAR